MENNFSSHTTLGKASLIVALLTIVFFILIIVVVVSAIFTQNPFIAVFSSIFSLLMFIFSITSIVLGAISYWGKNRDKYGLVAFIIGIVFLVLVFITIAISATMYVYVSGMIGGPSNENVNVHLVASQSENNCTLTIMHISDEDIKWSDISYTLTDNTNAQEIDCNPPLNEVSIKYNYEYLIEGKSIFIHGGVDNSDELKKNNEYTFSLTHEPTNSLMYSFSWTQ